MNKTVLITGCSSGFGRATAHVFAKNGWNVIATMRDISKSGDFRDSPNISIIHLDVQDVASVDQAIKTSLHKFGKIDVVINNAGFGLHGLFETTTQDKIKEQFDVNVFGVMNVTRSILPHFRVNRAGVILNISSGAGVFTLPLLSLYCASKFALEGYSEALTYELAPLGITVKIVEPGGSGDTNFRSRAQAEATSSSVEDDYKGVLADVAKKFEGLRDVATASATDVAEVIFRAATDGTDQLRYVATDDIKPWVSARRDTSEDEYLETMRSTFMAR